MVCFATHPRLLTCASVHIPLPPSPTQFSQNCLSHQSSDVFRRGLLARARLQGGSHRGCVHWPNYARMQSLQTRVDPLNSRVLVKPLATTFRTPQSSPPSTQMMSQDLGKVATMVILEQRVFSRTLPFPKREVVRWEEETTPVTLKTSVDTFETRDHMGTVYIVGGISAVIIVGVFIYFLYVRRRTNSMQRKNIVKRALADEPLVDQRQLRQPPKTANHCSGARLHCRHHYYYRSSSTK